MHATPQKAMLFRKNGQTVERAGVGGLLRLLTLTELGQLARVLAGESFFRPRASMLPAAADAPAFGHGFHGPIGRKTKGKRDASLRSRSNRRKA